MTDFSVYKYYKGEGDNPYANNDARSNFWFGEQMFYSTDQNLEYWKQEADRVLVELKNNDKEKYHSASLYSKSQFAIILYIEELFRKWQPYDDMSWIYNY